jgi:hypothetical protein
VIHYLAHYTHRVAIANGRILRFENGRVTFRWRDSANGNKPRAMTLDAVEFMRRFLLHVLPRGFVKIRHFGFLANQQRKCALQLCSTLLPSLQPLTESTIVPLLPRNTRASGAAHCCSGPGSQSNPGVGHVMIDHASIIFIGPAHRLGAVLAKVCLKSVLINRSRIFHCPPHHIRFLSPSQTIPPSVFRACAKSPDRDSKLSSISQTASFK